MKVLFSIVMQILTVSVPIWCRPQLQQNVQLQQQQQQQQQRFSNSQTGTGTAIPIISQSGSVGADGSFNFTYETGNGIHVQEGGYLKKGQARHSDGSPLSADEGEGDIQVIVGAFAYKSPEGTDIHLQYTADENGFHPVGDHLPTPPPIPPEIQRALSLLPQTEQHDTQQSNTNVQQHQFNQQSNVNPQHQPFNQESSLNSQNQPFNQQSNLNPQHQSFNQQSNLNPQQQQFGQQSNPNRQNQYNQPTSNPFNF